MKYVLYGILVLTIMQHSRAQYRKIQLTDAKRVEHLKLERLWARCKYNEGFIYNKDYMIYQACDTAVTFYPDRKTFQIKDKDYGFAVDKNGVYYQGQFVKVDTTGLEVLARRKVKEKIGYEDIDSYYWRTNGGVFFGTKRLSVSDPQTFEALTYCYFRDKNHVYYYDQIIEGVDPNLVNEKLTNEEFLNDGKNVYYKGERLYYKGEAVEQMSSWIFKTSKYVLGYNDWNRNEKHSFLIELYSEPFDIPTLRTLSDSYLIDKNHLYYIGLHYPIWDNGFRLFVPKEELSSIRAFTEFVVVGSTVYHQRKKSEKRYDAATFGVFPEHHYYQYDKKGIYNWDKKLPFRYTKRPEYGKNLFFIDEKRLFIYENQAYYYNYDNSIYAKNLTSQQIEILKQGKTSLKDLLSPHKEPSQKKEKYDYNLYKADGHIYIGKKLQKDVDAATFEYITDYFYKDKNHVYYYDRFSEEEAHFLMVEGYDVATLKGDSNRFMMDKDYYYYGTTRLFENRNVEVLAIYTGSRLEQAPMTDYCLFKNDQGYWFVKLGDGDAICFLGTELKKSQWVD